MSAVITGPVSQIAVYYHSATPGISECGDLKVSQIQPLAMGILSDTADFTICAADPLGARAQRKKLNEEEETADTSHN